MADDLDPFGRRKDENPLASLGWDGEQTASPAAPRPEPAGETGESPPPRRERTVRSTTRPPQAAERDGLEALRAQFAGRRRLPIGRLLRAVITVVVVFAVLGGIISTLVDEGVDRADRFVRELDPPAVQAPGVPGAGAGATPAARGLSAGSLLRPAAFGRAMTRLRTGGYGRLTYLRVAPGRIDASMLTQDGRLRQVQIEPGGAARVLATSSSGFAGARTMTMKGIDTGAPDRLTRSAARRLGAPTSRVDYLVLSEFAGARSWSVSFEGGAIFSADSAGRITRRVS